MSLTVSGAYGRDYKSKAAIAADWAADLDFIIRTFGPSDGRYINKADAQSAGLSVMVRYAADRKIAGPFS
jgi:hypothetical protein